VGQEKTGADGEGGGEKRGKIEEGS